jgi:thiol-disulfide isomerase/thioredoxin
MKLLTVRNKSGIKIFFLGVTVYLLLALIGGYISGDVKLIAGTTAFFLTVYYTLKNSYLPNKITAFFCVSWLPFFAFIWFNVFQFEDTWVSFWSSLFICIGAAFGWLFYKKRSILYPIILFSLIPLWFAFVRSPFNNKMRFGTYDGQVLFTKPNISMYDSASIAYPANNPDKYYILDCWTSSCGVCFRKFPIVDNIGKHADKSKFEIIAFNIPIRKEKKESNFKLLDSFPYTFKKLYAETQSVADSFGITGFPTTIVIKNNKVIFRGDFEEAIERFEVVKH